MRWPYRCGTFGSSAAGSSLHYVRAIEDALGSARVVEDESGAWQLAGASNFRASQDQMTEQMNRLPTRLGGRFAYARQRMSGRILHLRSPD